MVYAEYDTVHILGKLWSEILLSISLNHRYFPYLSLPFYHLQVEPDLIERPEEELQKLIDMMHQPKQTKKIFNNE